MLEEREGDEGEEQQEWKQFKDTLSNGRRKSITEQDIAVFRPQSQSRAIISSQVNPHSKTHN